jgi:endo-1,4-beta-xylanase
MADFAALGVDVAVTELDLRIRLPAKVKSLAAQAADYASVIRACRLNVRCVGVTTWGITDDRSWIPSFFSGYGAALPFDEAHQPKPAVAAMIEAWKAPAP